jgi:prepilin peptidase CpaA
MLHTLSLFILPTLMIVAALSDVASFRIPNWLTGLTAILFFPMAFATGMPILDVLWHLAAGLVLFVLGYALFAFGYFGGGDSKLMAAAGLWFGTSQSLSFLIMTTISGGVLALAFMAWKQFMVMWELHRPELASAADHSLRQVKTKLPYGFALAVGAILAFPQTWWMNVS